MIPIRDTRTLFAACACVGLVLATPLFAQTKKAKPNAFAPWSTTFQSLPYVTGSFGQPMATITVGEGKDAVVVKTYRDGRVEVTRADGKFRGTAQPGKTATFRYRGRPLARVARPGYKMVQRANLGVVVDKVPSALATHLDRDCSDMVLVLEVKKGQAAAKAGLRKHDIIYRIDDESKLSQAKLVKIVAKKKPGQVVELGVLRRGHERPIEVKLGAKTVVALSGITNWSQHLLGLTPKYTWKGPSTGTIYPQPTWNGGFLTNKDGSWGYYRAPAQPFVQLSLPKTAKMQPAKKPTAKKLTAKKLTSKKLTSKKLEKGVIYPYPKNRSKKSASDTEKAILELVEELQAQRKRVDSLLQRLQKYEAKTRWAPKKDIK